jgi:predicted metal-dependent HD superfamily phosphohydrolase
MSNLGRERWDRLWLDISTRSDGVSWFEVLAKRYAEPHRHYHTAQHIEECLTEFDSARHLAHQPAAVELAIWFHDAIYDTRATDNEEQSAVLSERCLSDAGATDTLRLAVRDLVLVTKTHEASENIDAPLLVDIDVSILGSNESRFREYETQVRREYAWVPDNLFASKRAEILERFLTRKRIYSTDWFFERREKQARANLQATVNRLRRE